MGHLLRPLRQPQHSSDRGPEAASLTANPLGAASLTAVCCSMASASFNKRAKKSAEHLLKNSPWAKRRVLFMRTAGPVSTILCIWVPQSEQNILPAKGGTAKSLG